MLAMCNVAMLTKPDFLGRPWLAGPTLLMPELLRAHQAYAWRPFCSVSYALAEIGAPGYSWLFYSIARRLSQGPLPKQDSGQRDISSITG